MDTSSQTRAWLPSVLILRGLWVVAYLLSFPRHNNLLLKNINFFSQFLPTSGSLIWSPCDGVPTWHRVWQLDSQRDSWWHLMPRSSICIMDLPALREPFDFCMGTDSPACDRQRDGQMDTLLTAEQMHVHERMTLIPCWDQLYCASTLILVHRLPDRHDNEQQLLASKSLPHTSPSKNIDNAELLNNGNLTIFSPR